MQELGQFTVRLQPVLLDQARKIAESEGIGLDQLINAALAEKLAAVRMQGFFEERAKRADVPGALRILERAGEGNPPVEGDEV